MKNLKFLGVVILMALITLFQSCDDNDGYSLGDIGIDYVTVHVLGEGTYSFTGDTWGTMWPAAPTYPVFRPVEGQRALLYFNPLYDDFSGYDVGIKVLDVYPILTKQVEELTEENEKEYGDDPIHLTDAWIGGGFMNLIFQQRIPSNQRHRVSLVQNTLNEYPEDGYVHLEFRYNTYGDTLANSPIVEGTVSYNLSSLDMEGMKGIKMRINSAKNGEKVLTFEPKSQSAPEDAKNLDITKTYVQ